MMRPPVPSFNLNRPVQPAARWRIPLYVGLLLLLAGCSSDRTRREWMTLFFDGVPGEGTAASEATEPTIPKVAKRQPRTRSDEVFFGHDPWLEDTCNDCHASAFSQKLKGTLEEVCYSCHDKYPAELVVRHDPVAEGACNECHESHKAKFAGLLKLPTPQGCYECHENVTEAKFKHEPAINDCSECHDPHATKFKGLLKLPTPQGCYECHDNVTEAEFKHEPAVEDCGECHAAHASEFKGLLKFPTPQGCYECHDNVTTGKFKHEPAVEDCGECHTAHASEFKGLLKLEANALCFECHDEKDTLATDVHRLNPGARCVVCHDPHGGDLQFYLKHEPASPQHSEKAP